MNRNMRIIGRSANFRWRLVLVVMCAFVVARTGAAHAQAQWKQLHKLIADDAEADLIFGWSVSISDGIAIVGAPYDDQACPADPSCNSGAAYLFDAATGRQLHKLTADDAAHGDHFGRFVSISGNIAVVGAIRDDEACPPENPDCDAGSAYVFDVTTPANPVQLHELTADDAAPADSFGFSTAIDGDVVVVGAHGHDDGFSSSGAAYVFDLVTGEPLHKLTANDPAADDNFGISVGVSGGTVIAGANGNDDACQGVPACASGSA